MSEVKNELPIVADSPKTKAESMSPFVRKLILQNLDDSNEQILQKCENVEFVNGLKPSLSSLYNVRMNSKSKYDVENFESLPRNNNGTVSVSAMAKLLIKKYPNHTDKQIREMLKADGLNIAYSLQRLRSGNSKAEKIDIVDAAKKDNPVVKTINTVAEKPDSSYVAEKPFDDFAKRILVKMPTDFKEKEKDKNKKLQYEAIEDQLDLLINKAREIIDSELVNKLKEVRKHIIIKSAKESV